MSDHVLKTVEFNGSPRSGKGTIVKSLCEAYPETLTAEETGIDYRAITRYLLENGSLGPSATPDDITAKVNGLGAGRLAEIVRSRDSIINQFGKDALYDELTSRLVPFIGQAPEARVAVKTALKERVSQLVQDGKYSYLLLDGRSLAPVVSEIAGVRVFLRIFVICALQEAAQRECLRKGVDPNSADGQQILEGLQQRSTEDQNRAQDPVKPDDDALSYQDQPAGIGQLAVETGKQIVFDTTNLNKEQMLAAAEQIFKEAAAVK